MSGARPWRPIARQRPRRRVSALAVVAVLLVAASASVAPSAARALSPTSAPSVTPAVTISDASDSPPAPGDVWSPALWPLAAAPTPGSGAWYWPTGSEDFHGWDGWLADRGSTWHIAQDMPAPPGQPVYAIGDGVVWKASTTIDGYGPGYGPGGVLIIVHTTASGIRFRTLYGHIMDLRYRVGQRVKAGAVIARINGCAHVHFSIHPSTVYRDGNPYAGHVPKSWADHGGFVNPVKFLKTHPRVIPYVAPSLPVVEIDTVSAPGDFGAAAGVAYWTEQVADQPVRYACDLATGERRLLAADEVVPPFDTARYVVEPLAVPATGFTVSDRLPVVGITVSTPTPAARAAVTVRALVTNAARRPFQGAHLVLERRSGTEWVRVIVAQSSRTGRRALTYTPVGRTKLRLRFVAPKGQPPATRYLSVTSATVTVTPQAR